MNKKWKKMLALALTMVTMLIATACSKNTVSESESDGTIKMTVCISKKNDLSFNQSLYEGAMQVQETMGDAYQVNVVEMGDDTTKWQAAFYDAADNGADIIIGAGFQNKQNFETIAQEYPDIKFILFDQEIDYSSGELDNVLSVLFKAEQSGFLAGAVAAYYTESVNAANPDKIIGFVGGVESVTINSFLVGYAEGANYVDETITVKSGFVGDFKDAAKAKDLGNAQISAGADILFQVAGGAGNGVIEAAVENEGVMAIGVDSDQYQALEGTNLQSVVITSSLKRLDQVLVKICTDYAENPTSIHFGSNVAYGLSEDAVGIVFNEKLSAGIGEANVANVKDILNKIQTGEIVVSEAANLTSSEIDEIVRK